jgi:peptidoglycan-associated lipoprotein
MKRAFYLIAALSLAGPATAQLPVLRRAAPAPVQNPIDVLRADFAAQAGGTIVYFTLGGAQLSAQARTVLAAQALWLRQHPEVPVRIEGRGDPGDTRSRALALGARRAAEARAYLLLLGVPSTQVSATSWGRERPGPPSATTVIIP